VEGKPHFDKPETEAVAQKMYELTELQKQGKFSVKRDKDVLSTAIGTKEHGGRIRGVSSKLTFRDGFEEDRSTYKRHDRYKEEMIQAAEKAAESKFKEMFAQLAEQQSGQIWMNPLQLGQQQSGHMVMMPPLVLAQRIRPVLRAVLPQPQHNHIRLIASQILLHACCFIQ